VESVVAAVSAAGTDDVAGDTPAATALSHEFYAHQGTIGRAKTEACTRKGSLIAYESIGFYHSSVCSSFWLYCLARRELGQNFG
jgi:hypothetical protein